MPHELNRRELLGSALVVTTLPILLPGCLFLLTRLILGRGFLRAFARGARFGGARSILTIGRGIAVAARAARLIRLVRAEGTVVRHTQILDLSGRLIANAEIIEGIYHCKTPDGDTITASRIEDRHIFHHHFLGGYSGRTVMQSKTRNDHFDARERFIGYDIVDENETKVTHYDERRRIGESKLQSTPDGQVLIADKALKQTLEALSKHPVFKDEELNKVYDEMRRNQAKCDRGISHSCRDQRFHVSNFLRELEKRY